MAWTDIEGSGFERVDLFMREIILDVREANALKPVNREVRYF